MKQDLQLAQAEGASFRDRSSALEVRKTMPTYSQIIVKVQYHCFFFSLSTLVALQEELKLCQAEAAQKLSLSASSEERVKVKMRQLEAEVS